MSFINDDYIVVIISISYTASLSLLCTWFRTHYLLLLSERYDALVHASLTITEL